MVVLHGHGFHFGKGRTGDRTFGWWLCSLSLHFTHRLFDLQLGVDMCFSVVHGHFTLVKKNTGFSAALPTISLILRSSFAPYISYVCFPSSSLTRPYPSGLPSSSPLSYFSRTWLGRLPRQQRVGDIRYSAPMSQARAW